MRIGSNIPDLQSISNQRTEKYSAASKAHPVSTEESEGIPEDTVSISALTAKALQMPEVRQDKVALLQQSVASGQYQLDPSALAAAMMSEV